MRGWGGGERVGRMDVCVDMQYANKKTLTNQK